MQSGAPERHADDGQLHPGVAGPEAHRRLRGLQEGHQQGPVRGGEGPGLSQRTILVTSALPYANGAAAPWPHHRGRPDRHLVPLPAPARQRLHLRLRRRLPRHADHDPRAPGRHHAGSADHGRTRSSTSATMPGFLHRARPLPLDAFSEENRRYSGRALRSAARSVAPSPGARVRQAYDEQAGMFLPDRFVRGTCPRCGTPDQYGDSCENCGATYSPADLKDAVSTITGTKPVLRDSEHLFFRLGDYEADLREWLARQGPAAGRARQARRMVRARASRTGTSPATRPTSASRSRMRRASISTSGSMRPIGYIGSFAALAAKRGLDFDAYWKAGATTELHHFIGKDISYFHTLFWPAMLQGAGFRRPTGVHVHGFLTVDGQKMSKSRGTHITARQLPGPAAARPPALLLRREAGQWARRHRLQPGRLHRPRELRRRRQAGQHRQPLRALHRARRRHAGGAAARSGALCDVQLPQPNRSPRCSRRATTPAPCARSCRWPTAPTSTWTSRSPGSWPRIRRGWMRRAPWPRRASTCSAC